jgi:acetolactate synthase-1/2/3 large subunit
MQTPFLTKETSAPEAICMALKQAGIDLVLGIPGGDVMRIYDALYERPNIRTVLVRQESLAGVMAEAYGRSRGKPAVVLAQGNWILSYAALGALEAFTGSAPVVFLTDLSDKTPFSHHAPTQTGTGHYGTWNTVQAYRGFMKEVMEAHHPAQAVQLTQLAIKHAMTGTPGPVAVVNHAAALNGTVGPDTRPVLYPTPGYLPAIAALDNAALERAAELLAGAERPVIVAGNGVRVGGAFTALAQLAEKLSAPVVTSSAGKGVFAETHPLAAGVLGEFGTNAAARVVHEADVVLAVGTRLGIVETMRANPALIDPRRQRLVQIDVEPRNLGWTFPVDCAVQGDAAFAMEQLAAALRKRTMRSTTGAARVASAAPSGFFDSVESDSSARPILPQRVIRDLREALPDNAVVCADAGENRIYMTHHYRTKAAGGFMQPASSGGMGYAIPAALGVKLARPDAVAVAVCGDGGFAIMMNGLMTSLEEKLPIVVVVFNNGMLGWVAHVQGNRRIASSLGDYDHAAIARAMGCDAYRVEDAAELAPRLRAAVASGRTTVIDVVTSPDETWEKVRCAPRQ